MNLHKAAEIVRRHRANELIEPEDCDVYEACKVLCDTMLSELDPTPISEEWLLENGWVEEPTFGVYLLGDFTACETQTGWSVGVPNHTFKIKALGELRTLLRLMGEMK